MADPQNPHAGQPALHRGPSLDSARLVAILIHGRGASAEDILSLADEFNVNDVAYLAPQAANRTWYPYSFLSPIEQNEPFLTSALGVLANLVTMVVDRGVPAERVAMLGFSQGACLTLEFAARNPRRYAAIVGLSGGLIGPPGTPRVYPGSLDGTPVFLGCSDVDAHIPVERVRETTAVFRTMKASVDERIYRGMGHTVNSDEISAVTALLRGNRG
jgi:phospholipase/carboxylesterase/glyoxalase family protein